MADTLFNLEEYSQRNSFTDYEKDVEGNELLDVVARQAVHNTSFSRGNQCDSSELVVPSREPADSTEQQTKLVDLTGESQSRMTQMRSQSLNHTGIPQSTPISETSSLSLENTICSSEDSPARELLAQESERDLTTQSQLFSGSSLDASVSVDPNLYSWSNLRDLSIADLEAGLEESEWQDIKASLLSTSQLINLERCIKGQEYSSCPTLLSGSRPSSGTRPAGTTDCECWWKNNVIKRRGLQLAPWAMALFQGFPLEWFQSISAFPTATQAELKLDILPGELSPHPRQPSPLEWSDGCGENERPSDRTNLPLEKSRASGWLEQRTKTIKGVTYPKVEGCRDKDNLDHWYWEYRYEEKSEKSISDNGYITRSVYLKGDLKKKIGAINLAIALNWPIQKILSYIRGEVGEI